MGTKKNYLILLFILSLSLPTVSTTMFKVGLEDLTRGSEVIVQAKVTAIVTQWNKDQTAIYTYIRMNIIDDLIGQDEDNEIIIQQIGGTIGSVTLSVDGIANYQVGEENVLFLLKDTRNVVTYQTMGMFQGKYRIYLDINNVRRVTRDPDNSVNLVQRTGQETTENGNNLRLDEFKTKVIEYINSLNKK